jgi:tRNA-splicing ligase RtcB
MGRNQARKRLDLAEEQKKLDDQGILHSIRSQKDLDEASSAYKDIESVLGFQEDLVEVVYRLTPLAVVKG